MEWRKELDRDIGQYVDDLIKKTTFFPAYKKSDKPANAQIWTAMGIMVRKIYEQDLKIQLLEGVLKEIAPKKSSKTREEIKQARDEVEQIMKEIARGRPITVPHAPRPKTAKSMKPVSMVFPKLKRTGKKGRKDDMTAIKENIKRNF
jgi:hypothetical protein